MDPCKTLRGEPSSLSSCFTHFYPLQVWRGQPHQAGLHSEDHRRHTLWEPTDCQLQEDGGVWAGYSNWDRGCAIRDSGSDEHCKFFLSHCSFTVSSNWRLEWTWCWSHCVMGTVAGQGSLQGNTAEAGWPVQEELWGVCKLQDRQGRESDGGDSRCWPQLLRLPCPSKLDNNNNEVIRKRLVLSRNSGSRMLFYVSYYINTCGVVM